MSALFFGLRNLAAFAAGFALAAALLSFAVSPPRVVPLSAKLDWLRARQTEFDTIFIGSSRMHRQALPAVFDAAMREAGLPVRSFNLSADGMRPPEDGYLLDRALAKRTAPLRFMIVECNPIELKIDDEDEGKLRVIHWHDTVRMLTLWKRAWSHSIDAPPSLRKRISDTWRNLRHVGVHTRYWIWNSVQLGHGAELLQLQLRLDRPRDETRDIGPARDGFIPPRSSETMNTADHKEYDDDFADLRKKGINHHAADGASQAELARKAALARRHGGRLVLVAPPAMNIEVLRPLPEIGSDVIFLDFSDPARFPELFIPEHRRDAGHLNTKGSELYTRLLARHLAAALHAP